MATFTIQFSVADEHMDRIRYALRKHFGPTHDVVTEEITVTKPGQETVDPETGAVTVGPETTEVQTVTKTVERELTGEELLARVRQLSIDNIKGIVMSVEAEEAAKAARDAVTSVTVE